MTATATRPSLPDFEGAEVTGSAVRVTNAGDGLSDAMTIGKKSLHIDDEVFYVLRGKVTQVNHRADPKDGDLTRVHTVKAEQITEIDDKTARKMLAAAADQLARAKAEVDGQLTLDAEAEAAEREKHDGDRTPPADVAADAADRVKRGK